MHTNYHSEDIVVLTQLFGTDQGEEILVFGGERSMEHPDIQFIHSESWFEEYPIHSNTIIIALKPFKHLSDKLLKAGLIITYNFKISSAPNTMAYKSLNYINNPDGSMRWLFPEGNQKPIYFSLYNAATFKGRLFSAIMQKWMPANFINHTKSGYLSVYYSNRTAMSNIILRRIHLPFALYLGIPGRNRKAVFTFEEREKRMFMKIPLNDFSKKQLANEHQTLQIVNNFNIKHFQTPKSVRHGSKGVIVLDDIKPRKTFQSLSIHPNHVVSICELTNRTVVKESLKETDFYQTLKKDIDALQWLAFKPNGINRLLIKNNLLFLRRILSSLPLNTRISLSLCHGDFTPWNMYLSQEKAHIYDWEQAREKAPALHDLFHFILHTEVLVRKKGWKKIRTRVKEALQIPQIQALTVTHQIDAWFHFKLYILQTTTSYMIKYARQSHLEQQAHWMMQTFHDILNSIENAAPEGTKHLNFQLHQQQTRKPSRSSFIDELFTHLHGQDYAVLKHLDHGQFSVAPTSDIDLLVTKPMVAPIISFSQAFPDAVKVKIVQKSYMTFLYIFFKNQSFLEIDLIHDFIRKSVQYMDPNKVLKNAYHNEQGIRLPSLHHQWEYIFLFYALNGAKIPEKYLQTLLQLETNLRKILLNYISKKYQTQFSLGEGNQTKELASYNIVKKRVRSQNKNSLILRFKRSLIYIKDLWREITYRKGMMITFSGVDGAGKSTVIEEFRQRLEGKYRQKVKVLRHRPSLFPILSAFIHGKKKAESMQKAQLPHTGTNSSLLSSSVRFTYYFLDYLLGQFYIQLKYIYRGYTVVYDRYYFDFITDGKRSNIKLPSKLVKKLYGLLIKPDVNFFLYADPNTVYKRKQELQPQTIQMLTNDYMEVFQSLQSKSRKQQQYICIENKDLSNTLGEVEKYYSKKASA